MKKKTFYLRRLFLISQNWPNCKEDPISSCKLLVEELYNAGVYLNLFEEICAGWFFLSIPNSCDKASVEQFSTSGKEGQYN